MQVRWYGHSFLSLTTAGGHRIAIDPFLAAAPPSAAALEFDSILLTHAHADHAGDALHYGARIVAPHEIAEELGRRGVDAIGMGIGGSARIGDARVWCTFATHSSSFDAEAGQYGGAPCGYVVDDGRTRLYHAGDTGLFGDMRTVIGDLLKPQAAAVPIGDHYTMGPEHAARAVEWLGARVAIPLHYGTFPVLRGTPEEFARHVGSAARVVAPPKGGGVELDGARVVRELDA